jgi:hypothetical protein
MIVYAFQKAFTATQYRVSHIDSAASNQSFVIPITGETKTTGLDGVSESQYSTNLFSYSSSRDLVISLDLGKDYFDNDTIGGPNIHAYVEFIFKA